MPERNIAGKHKIKSNRLLNISGLTNFKKINHSKPQLYLQMQLFLHLDQSTHFFGSF